MLFSWHVCGSLGTENIHGTQTRSNMFPHPFGKHKSDRHTMKRVIQMTVGFGGARQTNAVLGEGIGHDTIQGAPEEVPGDALDLGDAMMDRNVVLLLLLRTSR